MKQLHRITRTDESHRVGDGFPVRTMFSYNTPDAEVSPFLMLDYAGPSEFPAASKPKGVGMHPHRGFETVTLLYQGEVEHHDTAGNERNGKTVSLAALKDAALLVRNGEPKPVTGRLMNTQEEIRQAIEDFNVSRFTS